MYKEAERARLELESRKTVLAYSIQKHALEFGDYIFASGMHSKNKFNMENLPPTALDLGADIIVSIIGRDVPDAVFGVPKGGNLFATRVAKRLQIPLIDTYKEGNLFVARNIPLARGYALGVEDVITTGGSTLRAVDSVIQHSPDNSLNVRKILAIIRRKEADPDTVLRKRGIDLSYVFTVDELVKMFRSLYGSKLIDYDRRWDEL